MKIYLITSNPTISDAMEGELEKLGKMKNGVILVNPAMEPITDKAAVLRGLESDKIFGIYYFFS